MQTFRQRKDKAMDLLPPERVVRSVRPAGPQRRSDVVDVEFEVVREGGSGRLYPVFNDNRPQAVIPGGAGGKVRDMSRPSHRLASSLAFVECGLQLLPTRVFAGFVGGLALGAFLLIAGLSVPTPPAVVDPLTVGSVSMRTGAASGTTGLSVDDNADTGISTSKAVPQIVVSVIAGGKQITQTRVLVPAE